MKNYFCFLCKKNIIIDDNGSFVVSCPHYKPEESKEVEDLFGDLFHKVG